MIFFTRKRKKGKKKKKKKRKRKREKKKKKAKKYENPNSIVAMPRKTNFLVKSGKFHLDKSRK